MLTETQFVIKFKQGELRSEPDFNVSIKKGSQVLSFECFISDEDVEDSLIGMIILVFK